MERTDTSRERSRLGPLWCLTVKAPREVSDPSVRICFGCHRHLKETDFGPPYRDRLKPRCKACASAKQLSWLARNYDRVTAKRRLLYRRQKSGETPMATGPCRLCSGDLSILGTYPGSGRICRTCFKRECQLRARRHWRPGKDHARHRDAAVALKIETFTAYGGVKCVCCGETQLDGLTIDHIGGYGNRHRRAIMGYANGGGFRFYSYLRKQQWPDGYRVLCFTCNYMEHRGGCEHVKQWERIAEAAC